MQTLQCRTSFTTLRVNFPVAVFPQLSVAVKSRVTDLPESSLIGNAAFDAVITVAVNMGICYTLLFKYMYQYMK